MKACRNENMEIWQIQGSAVIWAKFIFLAEKRNMKRFCDFLENTRLRGFCFQNHNRLKIS